MNLVRSMKYSVYVRRFTYFASVTKKLSSMTDVNMIAKARQNPVDFNLADAVKTEVFYHLYTTENPAGVIITEDTIDNHTFNRTLPTKFFVHGWNSSIHKGNWYDGFKDAYLNRGQYNIVYVDWFGPGSRDFRVSSANVKPVGHFIGDLIIASKIDLNQVHIIGKSLGSHVAGFAGKRVLELTSRKINRITGLDPAGPKFEHTQVDCHGRLDVSDAEFVDIVHTDAGYYGFTVPIGTVDFYPNGGGSQPGCETDDAGHNNSHGRSNWYFLESITSRNLIAKKAESWEEFLHGKFNDDSAVVFGEDVPHDVKGLYYFQTNANAPYALSSNLVNSL